MVKNRGFAKLRATAVTHAIITEAEPPWTGAVVRLAQLTDQELRAIGVQPPTQRPRSRVPRRCGNPVCQHWLTVSSYRRGVCETCHATIS